MERIRSSAEWFYTVHRILEMMSPRRRRIRERHMNDWKRPRRGLGRDGFEGSKTRYKK